MNILNRVAQPIQPYSLKELAGMYNVNKKTLRNWLRSFQPELGERNGYYYNNNQVRTIFERLGPPEVNEKSTTRI